MTSKATMGMRRWWNRIAVVYIDRAPDRKDKRTRTQDKERRADKNIHPTGRMFSMDM
jgi:hypothetical protein